MLESLLLEDTWTPIDTDHVAAWKCTDKPCTITVREMAEDGILAVELTRTVAADGYETDLLVFRRDARTPDEAGKIVEAIVEDVDDRDVDAVAIGADPETVGDETFIHFYCVYTHALPDGIRPEDVAFADDPDAGPVETVSATEVDGDVDAPGVRVEIWPVPEYEVTKVDAGDDE